MGASLGGLALKLKQFVLGALHDEDAVCGAELCSAAHFIYLFIFAITSFA